MRLRFSQPISTLIIREEHLQSGEAYGVGDGMCGPIASRRRSKTLSGWKREELGDLPLVSAWAIAEQGHLPWAVLWEL